MPRTLIVVVVLMLAATVNAQEDGSRIDLLVVYTSAATADAGSTDAIETTIRTRVADTNKALRDSGVATQIDLVYQTEIAYRDGPRARAQGSRLTAMATWTGYHDLRDRYAADLVHLVVGSAESDTCGEAEQTALWPTEYSPFVVSRYHCGYEDNLIPAFEHELGHSMGLSHDRYSEIHVCCESLNKPTPYSHGYVNQRAFEPAAPDESRWVTIMSYTDQCVDAGFRCSHIRRFSNPRLTFRGDPMGIAGDEASPDVDGPADAARALNEHSIIVANWRAGMPGRGGRTTPLTLDLTCHGYDEGATRAYNCIPEPSQQHHMRTFVPAVGSACDRGSIAEFPAGRIVFQIRCRDGSPGQSASWSYSGQGRDSFVKPVETPRVWVRTSFSGSSARLSVWCRAPQENLVVNELLGTSWRNDGTSGI